VIGDPALTRFQSVVVHTYTFSLIRPAAAWSARQLADALYMGRSALRPLTADRGATALVH
jgi:hypothetical protein